MGELTKQPTELTTTIGGEQRVSAGAPVDVVQPHNHRAVLGTFTSATEQDARDAIAAAEAGQRLPKNPKTPFEFLGFFFDVLHIRNFKFIS